MKTRNEILNLEGHFTWFWNDKFFIETKDGCYIWSDPVYNGSGTLVEFSGDYADFAQEMNIDYGRDKGVHRIGDYCGEDIKILRLSHH